MLFFTIKHCQNFTLVKGHGVFFFFFFFAIWSPFFLLSLSLFPSLFFRLFLHISYAELFQPRLISVDRAAFWRYNGKPVYLSIIAVCLLSCIWRDLMLSMLGKNFSRRHFEIFSHFSQKIGFDISCKQFAWNVKTYFLGKNKKNIIKLSSAEFAHY